MDRINPRLTIQNTESANWLVTVEHAFNLHESITFTMQIPKSDQPLGDVQQAAMDRALRLLSALHAGSRNPG